jgi:antitoxin component of MazEF toxin-antitoxin module
MTKTLTRHGNSLALVIEKPILELLGIDAKTPLSIRTDGRCLIISPAPDAERRRRLDAALTKINRRYGRALKRLAE